jgi:hypothetical protein
MATPNQLRSVLDVLIQLLSSVGETNWHRALLSLRDRYDTAINQQEQKEVLSDILHIYGGMGSFSDLVLYQNGKLLLSQTRQLDDLRRQLFDLARQAR